MGRRKPESKPPKGSWVVSMQCVVRKEVVCDDCTERDAEHRPFDFAVSEREMEQVDWEVLDVKPND